MALRFRVWAIVAVVALVPSAFDGGGPAASAAAVTRGDAKAESKGLNRFAEHRYRIIGRLRLVMFWMTRDDVGGARMTWRSGSGATTVALLAGSDPQRAPRNLNQWVYLREETRADQAEVFALRTLADERAAPETIFDAGGAPLFGVSCASMDRQRVNSAVTTVSAQSVTYRMFNRLLEQVAASQRWKERETLRPDGADAGFLSAMERVMRGAAAAVYIHTNTVYDLSARRRQSLGPTQVGARTFDRLTRADLAIRNRTSGDITKFSVTYEPDAGVALPVQIFYQPSFWLGIELRLDDQVDVPADPADDGSVLTRIRTICNGAERLDRHVHPATRVQDAAGRSSLNFSMR